MIALSFKIAAAVGVVLVPMSLLLPWAIIEIRNTRRRKGTSCFAVSCSGLTHIVPAPL